jgi:NAD(P)-dependent dehydrogenase (short-subunit alcohol dehydrogenase family)
VSRTIQPVSLSGRVVVVTGGNRGIGLGLARGVARAGASVAIWARDAETNRAAIAELETLGVKAVAFQCDVSREAQVIDAASATRDALGPIDALFANAGITGARTRFVDSTLADWRNVMSVNLEGAAIAMREAARQMVESGRPGALIGVSSTSAMHGSPGQLAYSASKAGILALCRGLAVELARFHIRCNALVPGWTDTDLLRGSHGGSSKFLENTTARTPVRRWGVPADFETVAAFLADPLQSFHTGDRLVLDGGYTVY